MFGKACKDQDIFLASERELWIDALRGIGILLVVLGHTTFPYKKMIYGFHIPLFFMLSGYLWKRKDRSILHYLKRYIVPYFILCSINLVLQFLLSIVLGNSFDLKKNVIGIFYSIGSTEWMPNCSLLWYLTCIFVALLLFSFVMCIYNNGVVITLVLLSGCTSCLLSEFNISKMPWNIDSALMGVVFFFLGTR